MPEDKQPAHKPFLFSREAVVLGVFLAIAGYLLWQEHEVHIRALFPYWPWLLLLACPLMHFFMHGRRGHGHRTVSDDLHEGDDR